MTQPETSPAKSKSEEKKKAPDLNDTSKASTPSVTTDESTAPVAKKTNEKAPKIGDEQAP